MKLEGLLTYRLSYCNKNTLKYMPQRRQRFTSFSQSREGSQPFLHKISQRPRSLTFCCSAFFYYTILVLMVKAGLISLHPVGSTKRSRGQENFLFKQGIQNFCSCSINENFRYVAITSCKRGQKMCLQLHGYVPN